MRNLQDVNKSTDDLKPLSADEDVDRQIRAAIVAAPKAGFLDTSGASVKPDEIPFPPVEKSLPNIFGYRIARELSSGGQATVFKAIQESTGRAVAIKVLLGGAFVGSRGRKRFDVESAVLAKLNHPHIVNILDKGRTSDGSFFMVMDYIEGCGLDQAVERLAGNLSAILSLFVKIVGAVEEAHRHGVVHRDLKPMNILIDHRGDPHIVDFGLALLRTPEDGLSDLNLTRTGQLIGSLLWASPEQVNGQNSEIDSRCDIYSLGVLLYRALIGEYPYPTDGTLQAIAQHITSTNPYPLRGRGKSVQISTALEAVVLKCLAKRPDQRYGSASLLAVDLQAVIDGRAVSIRKKSRLSLSLFIALLIALLALATLRSRPQSMNRISPPTVIVLPSFVNSLGMRFVEIPAGTFVMGAPRNDTGRSDSEQEHQVTVPKAFYLSVTVLTRSEYQAMMSLREKIVDPELPIRFVSWNDANAFCKALSLKEKRAYRLPTEAEWEYACKTDGAATYGLANTLDQMAWFDANSGHRAHPVGLKYPNAWGLYDMLGNVRQWCLDHVTDDLPGDFGRTGSANRIRVVVAKGSDYLQSADECRNAARYLLDPNLAYPTVGFRIVCEVTQETNAARAGLP